MCLNKWRMLLGGFLVVVSGFQVVAVRAAEPDKAALQAVVVESADKYEKAFAAGDAKALALLFTPEAEYVDADGTVFHGRDAIQGELAATFESQRPGTIDIEIVSIRPVGEGVLVEEGMSRFQPKGDGPASLTRYVAMHNRRADGTWLIASVRELAPAMMTPHARLMALSWLIGSWREEVDGSITETTWKWSEDGNFLIADFVHRRSTQIILKGTHRVGWDAGRKQFRSWIFESTGGAGEGWWSGNEGFWDVHVTGTDSEGAAFGMTLTYEREGNDAMVVSQSRRYRGTLSLPADSHRIVRQPPPATIGGR